MSSCSQDATFGPVSSCRSFDFTLTFESAILALLPTSIFFLAAVALLWDLRKATRVLTPYKYLPRLGKQLCIWKVAIAVAAAICDAIALAAWASSRTATPGSAMTVAALALRLVSSLVTVPLVWFEFFRKLHASPLLPLYCTTTILCDAARIRTFAFIELEESELFFASFTAAFACRVFSWFLETAPKDAFVERAEGDTHITAEETSSFFARLLITSVDPILWKGFRTTLTIQSLGSIHSSYDAERLYTTGQPHWEHFRNSGKKYPLFRAMFKAFGGTLLAPILPCVVFSLAQIAQPTLVSGVIRFVESYQTGNVADRQPVAYGYGLIGAYLLVFLISTLAWSLFQMSALRCSVAVRGFLVQMIYRKTLVIHQDVAKEVGTGSSTSLMAVDIERMVNQLEPFHLLYSSLIIVMVGLVILYHTIGISFVSTIIVALVFIASVPYTTRTIPAYQKAWSQRTDMRVKLFNSVIRNIKAVKLSGYENILIQKLELMRDFELKKQRAYLYRILAVSVYTNWLKSILSMATLITYTIVSQHSSTHTVNTATFFTTISTLSIVTEPLLIVGQRYAGIMAATASLARIQEFLMREEKRDTRLDGNAIAGKKLSLGTAESTLLRDLTFNIGEGKVTMVVGQVGSGKSTFLHGLLGEVNTLSGTLSFPKASSVGFCAQDAWLRPGDSIRQNIQFMSSFNPALYRAVVKACALDVDFKIWPEGDKQKAQGLSGGQKQRVALARALYARPDILILDDVFSALDKTTEQSIFQALFGVRGLLLGKTVVLATNAIHRLPSADHILVLERNTIGEQGTFTELSGNPGAVRDLLVLVEAKEKENAVTDMHRVERGDDAASSNVQSLAKSVDDIEAEMASEQSKKSPFRVFVTAGGFYSFCLSLVLTAAFSLVPGLTPVYIQSWTSSVQSDQTKMYPFLGGYVAIEVAYAILLTLALWYAFCVYTCVSSRNLHRKEIRSILQTPLSYFDDKPIGRILSRFSQDLFVVDFEISNYWLNFAGLLVEMFTISIIIAITQPYIAPILAATFLICIAIQRFYLRTSRQVRRMDFVAKSPLYSLFGETIDTNGLKTIRAVHGEEQLSSLAASKGNTSQVPYYTSMAVKKWLNLILGLVVTVINCMLVLMAVLFREKTSSGLLAVALVQATSLVFTLNHTITSLADFETGLVAVSRVQEVIELPREEHESESSLLPARPEFQDDEMELGKGTQADEVPMHKLNKQPGVDWITAGSVRFQNVVFKYRHDLPAALKNLSFRVQGQTKVGIVGRSGCGKSTALQALFRMVECESGGIFIDGVDITTIPRAMLRNAMTIIPQDPLLLELSIRENLDLEGACTDQQIWDALQQTQCKALVEAMPGKLDTLVTADGGDFSRGERQLLALARALLRKRKLLVLDEASSSLDVETDATIQQVIRTAFARCTVITVAHRLQTLMDYDEIMVLSAGELVEQGSPQKLANKAQGAFSQLLRGEQGKEGQDTADENDIQELQS